MKSLRLLLALTAILSLGSGPLLAAKDPKLRTVHKMMATPQHLKESLPSKTYLPSNFKVSPDSPAIAKIIIDSELDKVTEFVPLPGENAREPKPRKRAVPTYPYELRRKGISGWAAYLMLIDTKGTVKSLYCYRTNNPELAAAGAEALIAWKFEPATVQNEKVAILVSQHMEFSAN